MAWRAPNFDFRWSRRARDGNVRYLRSSVLQFRSAVPSAALFCSTLHYRVLICTKFSMHRADSWIRSTIPFTKRKLCDFVLFISASFCLYVLLCNRRWSQLIFIPGNKAAHTTTKVWWIRKHWKEKGIDLWNKCIFESNFSSEYTVTDSFQHYF